MFPMKYLQVAAISMAVLAPSATFAAAPHTDLPTCYIHVHDGCFNTTPQCSDDDYQGFLENCDTAYPKDKTAKPLGFSAQRAPDRQTINSKAYKQKMQQLNVMSRKRGG